MLVKSDQDPKLFVEAYDELVDYLHEAGHMDTMTEELKSKDVKIINFYDVCIDYILLDAIEVLNYIDNDKSNSFLVKHVHILWLN